ncbi:D-2-hydroxyacid dehydrogenase [Oscillospiraceae bacterium OttesenSCG-928-G22]|nr:D-2-hydroxyacid dehydrogenase [Oscillospiraceae bacterium OttesenSCG-928-G22]
MYNGKTHIHIQNARSSKSVFVAYDFQVEELLKRNADIADKLHITIGSSENDPLDSWTDEDNRDYYEKMATADVLIGYMFPTKDFSTYAPNIKFIQFISSGVNHLVPFDWVPDGVKLINNRGVHLPKSGESFLMFLLMLNAKMPCLVQQQREGRWDQLFTSIIKGKTVTVYGVGNQGGEIARQAKRVGLHVIGIDPYIKSQPNCDELYGVDGMRDAFSRSDFLAIAAPLTEETRGIISAEKLAWLPKDAGVMNVSRGALLDNDALDRMLRNGDISCAILDVFDPEPIPADSYLWNTPNLIISPHVSSDDLVNYMPLTLDLTIENVRNMLDGKPFKNIVDIVRAY